MANRFDSNELRGPQDYRVYVPQPLEAISALAKDYSEQYKAGQALPSQLDLLESKIQAAPVDYQNKATLIKEARQALQGITDTPNINYADYGTQQKIKNVIGQYANDPRLQSIQSNYNKYTTQYLPYLNSKDAQKDLVLTDLLDRSQNRHSTGYKQLKPGEILSDLDYIQHQEHLPDVMKIMDKPTASGESLSNITHDKTGNYFLLKDGSKKKITGDDIDRIAEANVENYANTPGGSFRLSKILNQAGVDPKTSYNKILSNPNISKQDKDALKNELKRDMVAYGEKFIFEDVDTKYSIKNDILALKKAMEQPDNLKNLGMAVPGSTIQELVQNVPEDLKKVVSIENGKVKINYTELARDKNLSEKYVDARMGNTSMKPQDMLKKGNALHSYVEEVASQIGFDGKVTPTNYEEVLTRGLNMQKALTYEYKFTPIESEIVKTDIVQHPTNYVFKDKSGKPIEDVFFGDPTTSDASVFDKDKLYLDRRTTEKDSEGKPDSRIRLFYKDASGNTVEAYASPKAYEDKNYHNSISEIQQSGLDYVKTGKPSMDKSTQDFTQDMGFNEKTYNGPKPIKVTKDPLGNIHLILADKKNKHKQYYESIVSDGKGGHKTVTYDNLPQFIEAMNANWFSTDQGKGQSGNTIKTEDKYNFLLSDGE